MPINQLPLPLSFRPAMGRGDFFVTGANEAAVSWVDLWPRWPGSALILKGPPGSGKTHLAAVWAERARARTLKPDNVDEGGLILEPIVIDGIDPWLGDREAEIGLFHLYNAVAEAGQSLLITMRMAPAQADFALPDLASRLRAAPLATIDPPDDALLTAVLVKLFADRQAEVGEDVIAYVLPRMERSFTAARDLVAKADALALAERGRITIPLLRRALSALQDTL